MVDILDARHDLHARSASSRSRRTTSCATRPSSSRTTSPGTARQHTLTFGASVERYESENIFFPGSQSVYIYNSLADFYADANDYLANPNRTTSPVTLRRFQVRWMNIPGLDKPMQPLEVWYTGLYAQDEWQAEPRLKVTYGLRLDVPVFGDTGFANADADALTFRDEGGNPVQYQTGKLPDANILWSPRVGFNWDVDGDRNTQLRGGTGLFTGRPAYVWISNQIGNTGVLTGFEQLDNTRNRPFHPEPDRLQADERHRRAGRRATSWRSPIRLQVPAGVAHATSPSTGKLPWGMIGHPRGPLHARTSTASTYINANLPAAQTHVRGRRHPAALDRTTASTPTCPSAIVLKNQNDGYAWNSRRIAQEDVPRRAS